MTPAIDFSVVIPHRNSVQYLPKLLGSIPASDKVEIIIVDNSPTPVQPEDIPSDRRFTLLYSAPERGAGGARNVGIDAAHGRWLLFADADDFFAPDAFQSFYQYVDADAELVCFTMGAIFQQTGEPSRRGQQFTDLVQGYLQGRCDENDLRLRYSSPCAKMVSKELVDRHHLRYDEVVASNDRYFSVLSGYYARKILAEDTPVYIATVTAGSLTQRQDYDVMYSRLEVLVRCNHFLRQHGLARYQISIMNWLLHTLKARPTSLFRILRLLLRYKQSPFIGFRGWFKTAKTYRQNIERA